MPCLPPDRGYCRGAHDMVLEVQPLRVESVSFVDDKGGVDVTVAGVYVCRNCSYREVRRELAGVSAPSLWPQGVK